MTSPIETDGQAVRTATWRTSVNTTVLTAVLLVISKVTGHTIELDEVPLELVAPLLAAVAAVVAVFYRLSRVVTDRWPTVGYVLFGTTKRPATYIDTTPPKEG